MVAPLAVPAAVAGKKVADKAADNPAASLFLAVLVGAVLFQGLKNLPNFGEWALKNLPNFGEWGWNRIVPFDVTAPVDYIIEAVETTAALNEEVYEGIDQISAKGQDPFESFIFGDEDFNVYEPGEVGTVRRVYQAGRDSLFMGLINRAGNY